MYLFLLMGNRVLASHIPWEPLDRMSKMTLYKWVSLDFRLNFDLGVIPRAARSLFFKLASEYPQQSSHSARTPSGSGIRPPSRLSMQLSPPPASMKPKLHKIAPANKDWILKATYVEVYDWFDAPADGRSIMTNCVIYFSRQSFSTRSASLSVSV